jgi:hypothetical protein
LKGVGSPEGMNGQQALGASPNMIESVYLGPSCGLGLDASQRRGGAGGVEISSPLTAANG